MRYFDVLVMMMATAPACFGFDAAHPVFEGFPVSNLVGIRTISEELLWPPARHLLNITLKIYDSSPNATTVEKLDINSMKSLAEDTTPEWCPSDFEYCIIQVANSMDSEASVVTFRSHDTRAPRIEKHEYKEDTEFEIVYPRQLSGEEALSLRLSASCGAIDELQMMDDNFLVNHAIPNTHRDEYDDVYVLRVYWSSPNFCRGGKHSVELVGFSWLKDLFASLKVPIAAVPGGLLVYFVVGASLRIRNVGVSQFKTEVIQDATDLKLTVKNLIRRLSSGRVKSL